MKLFEVEVTTVLCVWAKDRREAERMAEYHAADENLYGSSAVEITANTAVNADWADSYPYGDAPEGYGSLTVEEIHDKWNEAGGDVFVPDPYTLPLQGIGI